MQSGRTLKLSLACRKRAMSEWNEEALEWWNAKRRFAPPFAVAVFLFSWRKAERAKRRKERRSKLSVLPSIVVMSWRKVSFPFLFLSLSPFVCASDRSLDCQWSTRKAWKRIISCSQALVKAERNGRKCIGKTFLSCHHHHYMRNRSNSGPAE